MIQIGTIEELLRLPTKLLHEADVVEVAELPDVPMTHPWSEKGRWTKRVVFTRKYLGPANGDTVFAVGGGHWLRFRDIA